MIKSMITKSNIGNGSGIAEGNGDKGFPKFGALEGVLMMRVGYSCGVELTLMRYELLVQVMVCDETGLARVRSILMDLIPGRVWKKGKYVQWLGCCVEDGRPIRLR